jgi:hypothetical protein
MPVNDEQHPVPPLALKSAKIRIRPERTKIHRTRNARCSIGSAIDELIKQSDVNRLSCFLRLAERGPALSSWQTVGVRDKQGGCCT